MFYLHIFENSTKRKKPSISFQQVGHSRGDIARPGLSTSSPVLSQTLWCRRCPAQALEAHSVGSRHPRMAACLPAKRHQSNPRSFHLAAPRCPFSCSFGLVSSACLEALDARSLGHTLGHPPKPGPLARKPPLRPSARNGSLPAPPLRLVT